MSAPVLIPPDRMAPGIAKHFPRARLAVLVERSVQKVMREMAFDPEYAGGAWQYHETPDRKGFFMTPPGEKVNLRSMNGHVVRDASPMLAGLCTTMTAYSHLSFALTDIGMGEDAERLSQQFHLLRHWVYGDDSPLTEQEQVDIYWLLD